MQRNACSIVLACLILAGCAKGGATRPHTDESSGRVADGAGPLQRISFWEPQLLYLLNSPHPRLHVEVDAVEGCQPSDATLNKLRDFLAAHCHKPGAVHVARGNVIPARDARGRSPGTLARQHADGPPRGADDPPPAFMHVLFYDGALCDQSPAGAATAPAARPKPPRPKHARGQPHVRLLPYPAIIFINTRYDASSARDEVLLHEA